jgi:hypothetical protein
MGLYERIAGTEEPKIGVHAFGSAVHLWLLGDVNNTRMINEFALTAQDQTDMLAIQTRYNGLSTANKAGFLLKTHSVFVLVEEGRMTKSEAATVLGFNE